MSTKILIIEDHDDFREMIKMHLNSQSLPAELQEASSAEEGIEKARIFNPEIILMDIRLPNMNGIDAATQIHKFLPKCSIIILTMFETKAFREIFKSKEITVYLGKSDLFEKLVPAIKEIIKNDKSSIRKEALT